MSLETLILFLIAIDLLVHFQFCSFSSVCIVSICAMTRVLWNDTADKDKYGAGGPGAGGKGGPGSPYQLGQPSDIDLEDLAGGSLLGKDDPFGAKGSICRTEDLCICWKCLAAQNKEIRWLCAM